jgi:YD repeat-containing protein
MHRRLSFFACAVTAAFAATSAHAQSATYHLHKEASTTAGLLQLKTAGPDTPATMFSVDLKHQPPGFYVVKVFDTQAGVPGQSGFIPAGAAVSFTLWMRKSANAGTMFPQAKLTLNSTSGTPLCTGVGTSALTTTLTAYALSCNTATEVSMSASDRFTLAIGANVTVAAGGPGAKAELDVEGLLNGNYDSRVVIPSPIPPPTVTSVSPVTGRIGTAVTITGSNFGAIQGASTVTFNGVVASPTSWSNTSIVASVPAGASSGPVVVTVAGRASSGLPFTVILTGSVAGSVRRASDGAPIAGAAVTVYSGSSRQGTATTTASGTYAVGSLTLGSYVVEASAVGYRASEQPVVVSAAATSTADFSLENASHGPVLYAYDPVGRLIQVTDPSGDFAIYRYDAVGNILSIDRRDQQVLAISGFTPVSGPPGTRVTIHGGGFAEVADANTVMFSGVPAPVQSASPTELVAQVPPGATTGPISVVTVKAAVSTTTPFNVTASSGVPTITSFTPTIGVAGTAISISGSNFDETLLNDRVDLNGRLAMVTGGSTTALTSTVPLFTLGGAITVATPFGRTTSQADFFVVPPPNQPADVIVTDRIQLNTSKAVTLGTADKIGLFLFDGTSRQRASFTISNSTIGSGSISIIRPDGVELAKTSSLSNSAFIDRQTLPMTGTYTVELALSSGATGSLTLSSYGFDDVTGSIETNGTGVPVTITSPGQNAELTFAGVAGQLISATASSSVWASCGFGGQYGLAILKPDGSTLTNVSNACGPTTVVEHQVLPVSGTYTLRLDPIGSRTGSATLSVYAFSDVTGPVQPNGSAVPVQITVPGQLALLTFSGTAGQLVSATSTSSTWGSCGFGGQYSLAILKPDGSTLASFGNACGPTTVVDRQMLPVSGTYTIRLDPYGANTGSASISAYSFVDVTGPIPADGTPVPVPITAPGQVGSLTFTGTAGQVISVLSTSSSWASCGFGGMYSLGIIKPDGSWLVNYGNGCGPTTFIDRQTLPVSGTYTVRVDPLGAFTGSATVRLYNIVDVTAPITVNGEGVPVTIDTPGQNALLTFTATAGQVITATGTSSVWTSCGFAQFAIYILKADGTSLGSVSSGCGRASLQRTLPADGAYTIRLDPTDSATGTATVSVSSP